MSGLYGQKLLNREEIEKYLHIDLIRFLIDDYPRSDYKIDILNDLISYKQRYNDDDSEIPIDTDKYNLLWADKVWNLFIEYNYRVFRFEEACEEISKKWEDENSKEYDELIDDFMDLFSILKEYQFDLYDILKFIKLLEIRSYPRNHDEMYQDARYVAEKIKADFLLSEFNRVVNANPHIKGSTLFQIKTDKTVYNTSIKY
jgi:hypothetical protein